MQLAPCEYKTGRTLGQGSYALVKEAVKISTGERFAVKMISKRHMRGREDMIINEINILKAVSKGHRNVLNLHDYFETTNNLYLVMDLCTGGELFDRICDRGSFTERDASNIIRTVVDAVCYLHSKDIIHRDIKESDSDLLLADFGLAKLVTDHEILQTTCGTPGYMAPEVIKKVGHGKPVDMWSIGVMTYFLLSGYMPFDPDGRMLEVVLLTSEISAEAKEFITKLLVVDPANRMTAEEALKHPWIDPSVDTPSAKDLLPNVRKGFDALHLFKKAVGVVKAINTFSRTSSASKLHSSASHAALRSAGSEDSIENGVLPERILPPASDDIQDVIVDKITQLSTQ